MKNMVVIMGGRFSKFSHETDFLICSSSALQEAGRRGLKEGGKESKLFQARELGIPVVNEEWLCSCARAGCLLSPPEGLKELKRVEIEDDIGVVRATEEAEKEVFTGVLAFVPLSRFEQAELVFSLFSIFFYRVFSNPYFFLVLQSCYATWGQGDFGSKGLHSFYP